MTAIDVLPQHAGDRPMVEQGLYEARPREALFFESERGAEQPILAAVYRREEPRQALFFKWIEIHRWTKQTALDGIQTFSERAANFLRIDLASGYAEIRIQKLNPNPKKSLREKLALYRELAGKLVEFDYFSPILIEPVIRRLLTSDRARVVRWQVRWADVGSLGGGVDPDFVRGVLKGFGNFSAVSLSADWLFNQDRQNPKGVRGNLNGRTNEVTLPNWCRPEEAEVILADVRRVRPTRLRTPELGAVARDHEAWRPVLQQIDFEFSVERQQQIELEKLAAEAWLPEVQTVRVAEDIARRFPNAYEIRYFVRCPNSGNPVSNEKGVIWFQQREDIPAKVGCFHAAGKGVATHLTAGRIKAVLLAKPVVKGLQILPWIVEQLEQRVGKTHVRNIIRGFLFLLFLVLYAPLLSLTTWLFLELTERFEGGKPFILVPYSLVVLLEAGIVVAVLGKPLTDKARDLLMSLASLFERSQTGGGELWRTVVHRVAKSSRKKSWPS